MGAERIPGVLLADRLSGCGNPHPAESRQHPEVHQRHRPVTSQRPPSVGEFDGQRQNGALVSTPSVEVGAGVTFGVDVGAGVTFGVRLRVPRVAVTGGDCTQHAYSVCSPTAHQVTCREAGARNSQPRNSTACAGSSARSGIASTSN